MQKIQQDVKNAAKYFPVIFYWDILLIDSTHRTHSAAGDRGVVLCVLEVFLVLTVIHLDAP